MKLKTPKTDTPKPDGPICPKCGCDQWAGPQYVPASKRRRLVPKSPTRFMPKATIITEHLVYSCNGCGFRRIESPFDTRKEVK